MYCKNNESFRSEIFENALSQLSIIFARWIKRLKTIKYSFINVINKKMWVKEKIVVGLIIG